MMYLPNVVSEYDKNINEHALVQLCVHDAGLLPADDWLTVMNLMFAFMGTKY